MIPRTLTAILLLALLAGCAAPEAATPAGPVETGSPPQSHSASEPAASEPAGTEAAPTRTPTETPAAPAEPPAASLTPAPEPSPAAPQGVSSSGWIAYIGADGNLRLVDPAGGEGRQLTDDAAPPQPGAAPGQREVTYMDPQWSSDGRKLAFLRQAGEPVETGYQYTVELQVYALETGERRSLVSGPQIAGFDWQPGADRIAYGLPVDQNYFLDLDPSLATGIWGVEAATGERAELVRPERGFPLVGPRWSPQGGLLAFEEVQSMEGRGRFALYDFAARAYRAWDRVIGEYSWSPDGRQIAYDGLAYIPSGEERIRVAGWQGSGETDLSPDIQAGYAFSPRFSPQGDRVAYLAELGDPAGSQYKLFVIPAGGGEPRELGVFEQPQGLAWLPQGERLALAAGPFGAQQVVLVSVADGSATPLAPGGQPDPQP